MIDSSRGTSIAVLGGGAAGIVAAISAKRAGSSVVICERLPRLGKKVLASGNGRCNLLNENLSGSFYNPASRELVRSIFAKFGKDDILNFFKSLGLETYSEEGRIFPVTNQSSSVLRVLEIELKKLSISVELNFEINSITAMKGAFILASKSGRKISCAALVIAGGGKSYPALPVFCALYPRSPDSRNGRFYLPAPPASRNWVSGSGRYNSVMPDVFVPAVRRTCRPFPVWLAEKVICFPSRIYSL